MLLGIGHDSIEIHRIRKTIEMTGTRFLKRIFTPSEILYTQKKKNLYESLAARFALKEAFSKAIGFGIGKKLSWKDIECKNSTQGKPYIVLNKLFLTLLPNLKNIHISISHTREIASAYVILES